MHDADDGSDSPPGVARERHRTTYDVDRQEPSIALVEAIAAAKDTNPIALDPVGGAVDLDALDSILESPPGDQLVEVAVDALGVRATIDSGGTVAVQETNGWATDDESDEHD